MFIDNFVAGFNNILKIVSSVSIKQMQYFPELIFGTKLNLTCLRRYFFSEVYYRIHCHKFIESNSVFKMKNQTSIVKKIMLLKIRIYQWYFSLKLIKKKFINMLHIVGYD